jgi:ribokinase
MPKVIVVGSINMDIQVLTRSLPVPGQTVMGSGLKYYPGGKGANQALAAAKGGIPTLLVARLGSDGFADALQAHLEQSGINISYVRHVPGEASGVGLIVVDERGENQIVMIPGANACLKEQDVVETPIDPGDVVICQFETPADTVRLALEKGHDRGAITILNPAPANEKATDFLALADILVLNETELSTLSNTLISGKSTPAELDLAVDVLRSGSPLQSVVLTLGADGALLYEREKKTTIPGKQVVTVDTTGAGDCFVGSLGARLALGDSLVTALEYANVAASICVQSPGASPAMPAREVVIAHLNWFN